MELSGFYWVLLVACFFSFSHALECYVCTNQEGNSEKCLKSTETCEQGQDTCFMEIKWSVLSVICQKESAFVTTLSSIGSTTLFQSAARLLA